MFTCFFSALYNYYVAVGPRTSIPVQSSFCQSPIRASSL